MLRYLLTVRPHDRNIQVPGTSAGSTTPAHLGERSQLPVLDPWTPNQEKRMHVRQQSTMGLRSRRVEDAETRLAPHMVGDRILD